MLRTATVRFYASEGAEPSQRFRWQVTDDSNGEIVGASTEGYLDLDDARLNFQMLTGFRYPEEFADPTLAASIEVERAERAGRYAYHVVMDVA